MYILAFPLIFNTLFSCTAPCVVVEVTRRKLGLPRQSNVLSRSEREVARLKRERLPENSMYPSAGPRLGVFNVPGPQTTVMPPAPPNLAEVHVCIDRGTMCTVINIHNTSFCETRAVFLI